MTAGYSATPMAAKLGVKSGHRVRLLGAARAWSIHDLPSDVHVTRRAGATPADVAIAFVTTANNLSREIAAWSKTITADGSLWIAWPRRAAGWSSDITDNIVRAVVLPFGLVDVKVAALDREWSALKMMWRKELRAPRR